MTASPVASGPAALLRGAMTLGRELLRLLLRRPVMGAIAVPVDAEGRIVLLRRADTGTWCLPGGVMEWGERVAETLRRELREETGYRVDSIGRVVGVYSDPARDERMHAVCVVVEVRALPDDGAPPLNPLEVLEVRAFDRRALPADLAFDMRRLLDDYLAAGPAILA